MPGGRTATLPCTGLPPRAIWRWSRRCMLWVSGVFYVLCVFSPFPAMVCVSVVLSAVVCVVWRCCEVPCVHDCGVCCNVCALHTGADPKARNKEGKTPADVAKGAVKDFLLSVGACGEGGGEGWRLCRSAALCVVQWGTFPCLPSSFACFFLKLIVTFAFVRVFTRCKCCGPACVGCWLVLVMWAVAAGC